MRMAPAVVRAVTTRSASADWSTETDWLPTVVSTSTRNGGVSSMATSMLPAVVRRSRSRLGGDDLEAAGGGGDRGGGPVEGEQLHAPRRGPHVDGLGQASQLDLARGRVDLDRHVQVARELHLEGDAAGAEAGAVAVAEQLESVALDAHVRVGVAEQPTGRVGHDAHVLAVGGGHGHLAGRGGDGQGAEACRVDPVGGRGGVLAQAVGTAEDEQAADDQGADREDAAADGGAGAGGCGGGRGGHDGVPVQVGPPTIPPLGPPRPRAPPGVAPDPPPGAPGCGARGL